VDELLDAMERRLAALAIQLARLFPEEPLDVEIAPVGIRPSGRDEGLEPGRRVAERRAGPLDQTSVFLF